MSKMRHPNIIELKDFLINNEIKNVYMVTEFITGKRLDDWLQIKSKFKEWEARFIFTEVLKGL